MKNSVRTFSLLFALGAASPAAKAALAYQDGDIILGLRVISGQGVGFSYEVNLGQGNQFMAGGTFATGSIVNLGVNLDEDLVATYGADFLSRAEMLWSISGKKGTASAAFPGFTAANNMFATKEELTLGVATTAFTRASTITQGGPVGKMNAFATAAGGFILENPTANNPVGALVDEAASANDYRSHMPGGANSTATSAYSYFNGGIEGAFGKAIYQAAGDNSMGSGSVLDIYAIASGSGSSVLLGAFRFREDGTLQFSSDVTDFAAVPEPATGAMLALGLVALAARRRRRAVC